MGAALCSNGTKVVSEKSIKSAKQLQTTTKPPRLHEKLWSAVESNNVQQAELYFDFNEINESNLYDTQGQTMLHLAAGLGYAEMLMLLIDRTGAKPDMVNQSLMTPLHMACRSNRQTAVKFLIGCGVDVNIQDEHGQTPLLICCVHGHHEILIMLVEASIGGHLTDPLEIDLANHQGLTPLNCAAIKGDYEMVKCLVSRGDAKVDQSSPKGCTPLIYAGRGGFSQVVEFLIQKKASPLKQDNAGGTVLHHAIEKAHIQVLETMVALGVDVYSAIEIADNAGRTPLFEAVENDLLEIVLQLSKSKTENGFCANLNVVNYNGQTPLFIAAKQGSLEMVTLLMDAGALPDLNQGELVKPEDQQDEDEEDSPQEKHLMEAFKNAQTPLQVAAVLGYEEIVFSLAQRADVNYQTTHKSYTVLHLCVLANRPELLIELLTKYGADPMVEDKVGRTLLDMIYQYIPSYVSIFQSILETMQVKVNTDILVQDDERQIQGVENQDELNQIYLNSKAPEQVATNDFQEADLEEIQGQQSPQIESAFGTKIALCLASSNWQLKEQAMKQAITKAQKFLSKSEITEETINLTLVQMVIGAMTAVSVTARDKIIKVFNLSLQLFNLIVQSTRVEKDSKATSAMLLFIKQESLIHKFMQHSEQSNTRVTNKIHEALLDLAYLPAFGEDLITNAVYEQIRRVTGGQNNKGLLAQLALLYKLVNTFEVHRTQHREDASSHSGEGRALTWYLIMEVVMPSVTHPKDDIRLASVKILVDVQKKTGLITLADFDELPDKVRESVWDKISKAESQPIEQQLKRKVVESAKEPIVSKLTPQQLEAFKKVITEKGQHKDWTQREIALTTLQECFSLDLNNCLKAEDDFLGECSMLLQTSLDENNIQIYLIAIDVALQFIVKLAQTDTVMDALPSMLQSIVLRTTDTNTRVRKQSVEVISQVWDLQLDKKAPKTACQIIAQILTDSQHNEKAIVGRLGLFIKKANQIESTSDLSKKPLQLLMGLDYEQLTQFSCQWCLHKNTKVRQAALKLAVEICRLNSIDTRGGPFKNQILQYVLGLRNSIRDPLIKKINEVCTLANPGSAQFINEAEFELGLATKNVKLISEIIKPTKETLPQITVGGTQLPSVIQQIQGLQPTIVLPHSEPLSEEQLQSASQLIELFGLQLITCFYSQTWSSRHSAIEKVNEQLHQLDPNRRDAMSAEINRDNLPPEISFKTVLKLCEEGLKDPVLKNYLTVLDLIQSVFPVYLRYLRLEQIKRELTPLIKSVINKTSDMKLKVREASMNFCLYLSHQQELGTETLVQLVVEELDQMQFGEKQIGNSAMIVSCLSLLTQFQSQSKLINKPESPYFAKYSQYMNKALKHSNPAVRREAEVLFKVMYAVFGDSYTKELKDQKSQLVTKIILDAKSVTKATSADSEPVQADSSLDTQSIQSLLGGDESLFQQLKMPNPKKRLIAVVEVKKTIHNKLTGLNPTTARDLLEPLSLLMRHLLRDDNSSVYLEALNLLKFVVGNLAQHLSALDLHLMMGQFIQVIVSGQQQIRARVAGDKVIVYFSKHSNIGSLVVAKEVLKNIERLNRTVQAKDNEKNQVLCRFYGLLQMLLQQFSIVLCYQPDFYQKCLELLADSMSKAADEHLLRSATQQLVISLHQIDGKVLEAGVSQLDFTKKTHIKKVIIELQNSSNKGLIQNNQNLISGSKRLGSPNVSFGDTQQSFTSASRMASPGLNMNRRLSRDQKARVVSENQTATEWQPRVRENQTGASWLEQKSTLPQIERRRQPGQGFVGTKAAGFNRDNFNMTGDYSSKFGQGMTTQNGIGTGLLNAPSKVKAEDKITNVPLYVPTERRGAVKRVDQTLKVQQNKENCHN